MENFKSFKNLDVKLNRFNVLIGPNAAGKSNFVSGFRFLRDVVESGLDNAISMQGGVEYIRNMNLAATRGIKLGLTLRPLTIDDSFPSLGLTERTVTRQAEYALKFSSKRREYAVTDEMLSLSGERASGPEQTQKSKSVAKSRRKREEVRLVIKRHLNSVRISANPNEFRQSFSVRLARDFLRFTSKDTSAFRKALLLQPNLFASHNVTQLLKDTSIYDFDPKVLKQSTLITGKKDLEYDGRNLAIVLKNILDDPSSGQRLQRLIEDLLPFLIGLDVETLADKSVLTMFKETYNRYNLPAPFVSDGTINVAALLVALNFGTDGPAIIEEPEKNIHPSIISKLVEMMHDVSHRKQIILTTHNPLLVRYAGMESLLLVSRDPQGFSRMTRPVEKDDVRNFLKNDMGVDELYVQNLL